MSYLHVTQGDAAHLPLADASVDLIVTSPPYFGLRSYTDNGVHMTEQVGAEATPTEYLDALIACTAEWMRVLTPGGSIFVNLGDKYSGYLNRPDTDHKPESPDSLSYGQWLASQRETGNYIKNAPQAYGIPYKSLMMLPQRYAIRCIDQLGLILRAEIVWSKPNGLPESVTDRVRRSHEQVFHFVKQPRYYSAVDEIREATGDYKGSSWADRKAAGIPIRAGQQTTETMGTVLAANPLGKLPGSVWTIPTAPLTVPEHLGVDHFAAYPPELVRRIVLGWSPLEVCVVCGEGRRPVSERETVFDKARDQAHAAEIAARGAAHSVISGGTARSTLNGITARTIIGYACGCAHPTAPTRPGVVLDPMGGTGTTALVASVYGRDAISIDLSHDYTRLARWRVHDERQRALARLTKARTPTWKPIPVSDREVAETLADLERIAES